MPAGVSETSKPAGADADDWQTHPRYALVSDHHCRGLLVVQRARPEVGLGLAHSTSRSMGTASTVKGVNTPDGGGHG